MKNEIIFFEIVRVFGNPNKIDLNFDEIDFDSNNAMGALDGMYVNIEHIAVYYQIFKIRLCFTITDDDFSFQMNSPANANLNTQVRILKKIRGIKKTQSLTTKNLSTLSFLSA